MSDPPSIRRRRLLAAGAAGLAGLAGCSGGGDDGGGGGGGGGGGDDTTPTPTPTPTPNATATTPPGPSYELPAFVERTRAIADGIAWHATEWGPAMARLRTLAQRVAGTAEQLLDADTVTENDVATVAGHATAVAEYLADEIQPHYAVSKPVIDGDNVHVQQLEVASRRGDTRRRDDALRRLRTVYTNYSRTDFYERVFTNGPITAKLYDDLGAADDVVYGLFHPPSGFVEVSHADETPEDPANDGVPAHVHEFPSGHVTVAHVHDRSGPHGLDDHENEPKSRRLYAYRNGAIDVLEDTRLERRQFDDFEPALTGIFRSVSLPDRRTDVAYVTVNRRSPDFAALPVQIQTFDGVEAASEGVSFLLDTDVFQDGTERIGGRPWRRIYYTQQETTIYAFLLRAGPYVLTVFPESVPWGRRVDWPEGPLSPTWLWTTASEGGDEGEEGG